MSNIYIGIDELIVAYRKAKVDVFFETGHLTSLAFAEYEEDLISNLKLLQEKINRNDLDWFDSKLFFGAYYFSLKKVDVEYNTDKNVFYSSSRLTWDNVKSAEPHFRILGKHSVHFHVFSSLWIEKVGRHLESLISENSYGCRLRYSGKKDIEDWHARKAVSHFRSYLPDYQKWQYRGIEEVKKTLAKGKKVIAVTADLTKYYHRVDCSFIKEPKFLESLQFGSYTEEQIYLNEILIRSITGWSKVIYNDPLVPEEFKYKGHCGIPMGLGAAKVIANLLLNYLDKKIESELKPIYYGRYVDDLFLVLEDGEALKTPTEFWQFVIKRIPEIKKGKKSGRSSIKDKDVEYLPKGNILEIPFAKKSLIEFGRGKEKFFFLEGVSGESFLNTLKESLEENSSEWKLPPNTDNDLESFSEEMANASSHHQESANGLRKSDGVSIRRLKLILYLKRFETAVSLLPRKQWEIPLQRFFDLALDFTITPDVIATYSKYYGRILALAIKVKWFDIAERISNEVRRSYITLKIQSLAGQSDEKERTELEHCLDSSLQYQEELIFEAIYCSYNPLTSSPDDHKMVSDLALGLFFANDSIFELSKKIFVSDLHQIPFREVLLYPITNIERLELPSIFSNYSVLVLELENLPDYLNFREIVGQLWKNYYPDHSNENFTPQALYFFTRPFTLLELSFLFPEWHRSEDRFKKVCNLFHIEWERDPFRTKDVIGSKHLKSISLKAPKSEINRVIAFTSLETKYDSWVAVVREDGHDPDITREQRILDLSASMLKCKKTEIDYVLFPELSIPRKLLFYLSNLFLKKKISIIAGFEYKITKEPKAKLHGDATGFVSSQMIYILCIPGKSYFQHIAIIQEKVIPAQEEERELFDVGGKYMVADNEAKYLINHGGFWFSGLICNDFLNIENRSILRGTIDALVVIEWNRDINTYNSLVEASANDLHTYIMQVNNRSYGDTRLRGPYKEDYKRDIVRVRGGELDYFVVASLDVEALREFQRYHRSPITPFKPVPTGFEMSKERSQK